MNMYIAKMFWKLAGSKRVLSSSYTISAYNADMARFEAGERWRKDQGALPSLGGLRCEVGVIGTRK